MILPDRMKNLPLDSRGFPIPWVVYRDPQGRAHFTINDFVLYTKCLDQSLCPICGGKLFRGRWFVGGPGSAFDPRGLYSDPPMHFECFRFAMVTCPFLAAPRYAHRIDDATLGKKDHGVAILLHDEAVSDDRPKVFVGVFALGQDRVKVPNGQDHVRAKRPYAKVEFWQHGVLLDEGDAVKLLDEEQRDYYRVVKRGIAERRIA